MLNFLIHNVTSEVRLVLVTMHDKKISFTLLTMSLWLLNPSFAQRIEANASRVLLSAQTQEVVRLFDSPNKTTEVGLLNVTKWGSGILKSDYGAVPLDKSTVQDVEGLWGHPIASEQGKESNQRTFELWGLPYSGQGQWRRYEVEAKFAANHLCSYTIRGGLISNPRIMLAAEDTLHRREGPRDTSH